VEAEVEEADEDAAEAEEAADAASEGGAEIGSGGGSSDGGGIGGGGAGPLRRPGDGRRVAGTVCPHGRGGGIGSGGDPKPWGGRSGGYQFVHIGECMCCGEGYEEHCECNACFDCFDSENCQCCPRCGMGPSEHCLCGACFDHESCEHQYGGSDDDAGSGGGGGGGGGGSRLPSAAAGQPTTLGGAGERLYAAAPAAGGGAGSTSNPFGPPAPSSRQPAPSPRKLRSRVVPAGAPGAGADNVPVLYGPSTAAAKRS
jgi:hypothetical protein